MSLMDEFEEVPVLSAGKRLGVQWSSWMGDWFNSWSPRNSNSNAEGPWDQWVDLAIAILQDEFTEKLRPEAHAAVAGLSTKAYYDDADRHITDEELQQRFRKAEAAPDA